MAQITERREVRVHGDEASFVFAAEPEEGRLVIREERDQGEDEELCALTIADRDELSGFLAGLRRVLGVEDAGARPDAPIEQRGHDRAGASARARPSLPGARRPAPPAGAEDEDEDDRRAAMERARARGHGNAFQPWSRDEERRLLAAVEAGRDLDELAREHGRSRRALELRLERLRG